MYTSQTQTQQQPIRARDDCAHLSICDHWALRCMSRCLDQVVSLKRNPQCFSPQASLGVILSTHLRWKEKKEEVHFRNDLQCTQKVSVGAFFAAPATSDKGVSRVEECNPCRCIRGRSRRD
ncbi:hypothetical protein TNCV_168721 [Trichonephila clavipes]|nr:hypothetical protein TNCV_168721 [Trichonephila clavipes]